MTDDLRFERTVAEAVHAGAPVRAPDELLDHILDTTSRSRPRPRLVAIAAAPTMRRSGGVAVGSPALRLAALVALLLAAVGAILLAGVDRPVPYPIPADRGRFTATGEMSAVREAATATRLADGRVLVAGGYPDFGSDFGPDPHGVVSGGMHTGEVWDPAAGSFTASGRLLRGRWGHAAVLLPDERVLIVGGRSYLPDQDFDGITPQMNDSPREAELWDPATGAFEPAGQLTESLTQVAAWAGGDGRIWIVGVPYAPDASDMDADGFALGDWVATVWDPATMRFENASLASAAEQIPGSPMPGERRLWVDGRLALVWDPATETVTQLRTLPPYATKTLLPDGRVLVAGGAGGRDVGRRQDRTVGCGPDALLWDPATGISAPTGPLGTSRGRQAAALLADGRVLVVGNYFTCDAPWSAEIFELR